MRSVATALVLMVMAVIGLVFLFGLLVLLAEIVSETWEMVKGT